MKKAEDILLVFPPQWTPIQPYLSLPCLCSYLKANDISAIQRDLNLEFYHSILSRSYLEQMWEALKQFFYELKKKSSLTPDEQQYFYSILMIEDSCPEMLNSIDDIKNFFRTDSRFFDLKEMTLYKFYLNTAFNIINIYCGIKLCLTDMDFSFDTRSYEEVREYIINESQAFLNRFFKKQIEEIVTDKELRIIGFSVTGSSQLIPALSMASWIKKNRPEIHITFGGNLFSRCHNSLGNSSGFFEDFADSIILFEGERPLLELVRAIKSETDLTRVSNLVYYINGSIIRNTIIEPVNINTLPAPDFDGLLLDYYFSPFPILPLLTSRGCYWNKCAFCDHSFIYNHSYQQRDASKTAADLALLQEKYGVKYFSFSDEAISPAGAKRLSSEIINASLDVSLIALARLEPGFTEETVELMVLAGFKILFIGLESASPVVLKKINKGINISRGGEFLKRFHSRGLLIHFFIIFGFPGETPEDEQKTIDFVLDNQDSLLSVGASVFQVGKYSPIARSPEQFGITLVDSPDDYVFSHLADFNYNGNQTHEGVNKIKEYFMKLTRQKMELGSIWGNMMREYIFLYTLKYNKKELNQIALEFKTFETPGELPEEYYYPDNLVPIINKKFILKNAEFDIFKIQQHFKADLKDTVETKQVYFFYNRLLQRIIQITPNGYQIALLCNGCYRIDQIVESISIFTGVPKNTVRKKTVNFLKKMNRKRIIDFLPSPELIPL